MYRNLIIHFSSFSQRENFDRLMLGREKWRGFHSRTGASNGEMNVVGGVKVGARVGWLEGPLLERRKKRLRGWRGERSCVLRLVRWRLFSRVKSSGEFLYFRLHK